MIISSSQNSLIKELQLLQKKKKERTKQGVFIVEGLRAVQEIPKGYDIHKYIVAEGTIESMEHIIKDRNVPTFYVTDDIFKNITDTQTPQGIMAVVSVKEYDMEAVMAIENGFFVISDEVQDPGNLGTLIRTAHAAGANGIFLSKGCVDVYNPKTIRSTMGSIFHIPVFVDIDMKELIEKLYEAGTNVYATSLEKSKSLYDYDYTKKSAIVIGNEANGISSEVKETVENFIRIPMPGNAESLNASIAAGICMYEIVRQRTMRSTI